jgi:hypothetical protein
MDAIYSVVCDIGLYAEEDTLPDVVVALYKRLLVRGSFLKLETEDRRIHSDTIAPEYTEPSEEHVRSLVADVVPSGNALHFDMTYELRSGRVIWLDLDVYGNTFMGGLQVLSGGQVVISLDGHTLMMPIREAVGGHRQHLIVERHKLGHRAREKIEQARRLVLADEVELFVRTCDLIDTASRCGGINHGVVWRELGRWWPPPFRCNAVFHRDPAEFARDFVRTYLDYNKGIRIPATLPSDTELWQLELPPEISGWGGWGRAIRLPSKGNERSFYNFAPSEAKDLSQFLDSLTEEKVRQLSMLPGEDLRELLIDMFLSDAVADIAVHDFGDCGLALVTDPYSTVWTAYKYIAEKAL